MKYLELTLLNPAGDLACDEALLDACDAVQEAGTGPDNGVLRFWLPAHPFVVLGFGNKAALEVNLPECEQLGVPVLRRCSGGGTVVQGPGCLNYSIILPIASDPGLESVTSTNRFIMERMSTALTRALGRPVSWDGCTDLTLEGRKFSGNAQRRKRHSVLFHGTLLLDFDLGMVSRLLPMPSRQPDYRRDRSHGDFLTNLHVSPQVCIDAIKAVWHCHRPLESWPEEGIQKLVAEKYSRADWNFRS